MITLILAGVAVTVGLAAGLAFNAYLASAGKPRS